MADKKWTEDGAYAGYLLGVICEGSERHTFDNGELVALLNERDELRAACEALREVVASVEWEGKRFGRYPEKEHLFAACPRCDCIKPSEVKDPEAEYLTWEDIGHDRDCKLQAVLRPKA